MHDANAVADACLPKYRVEAGSDEADAVLPIKAEQESECERAQARRIKTQGGGWRRGGARVNEYVTIEMR